MKLSFLALCTLSAALLTGCSDLDKKPLYPEGPGFKPTNVYQPYPALGIRRVALLPAYDGRADDNRQRDLDSNFSTALSATGRFEVTAVSRNELISICGRNQVNSTEGLPPRLLPVLRAEYGAEAVMFVDITRDEPFKPLALGVRAKLVDTRGGQPILWSCDTVFNSGDPAVANSAKRFQLNEGRQEFPVDQDGSSVLLSPSRFSRYAAGAVFATLPK